MLEIYINPKFKQEALEWRDRAKNFNYFQVVSPEVFDMVNNKNKVFMANNPKYKAFNIIAN